MEFLMAFLTFFDIQAVGFGGYVDNGVLVYRLYLLSCGSLYLLKSYCQPPVYIWSVGTGGKLCLGRLLIVLN